MKRNKAVLSGVFLVVGCLYGCGGARGNGAALDGPNMQNTQQAGIEISSDPADGTRLEMGDSLSLSNGLNIKVSQPKSCTIKEKNDESDGHEYAGFKGIEVELTVKNESDQAVSFSSRNLKAYADSELLSITNPGAIENESFPGGQEKSKDIYIVANYDSIKKLDLYYVYSNKGQYAVWESDLDKSRKKAENKKKKEKQEAKKAAEQKAALQAAQESAKASQNASPPVSYDVWYAQVDTGYLALRNAKEFNTANEIGKIQTGETVWVPDGTNIGEKYWYVYVPSLAKYGFVNSDYLYYSSYSDSASHDNDYWTVHVDSGYLALRSEKASNDANIIGKLYTGERVQVWGMDDTTFWYVYAPTLDMYGYVNSNYLY